MISVYRNMRDQLEVERTVQDVADLWDSLL